MNSKFTKHFNEIKKSLPKDLVKYFNHFGCPQHKNMIPNWSDRGRIEDRVGIWYQDLKCNENCMDYIKDCSSLFPNGLNIILTIDDFEECKKIKDEFHKYLLEQIGSKDILSVRIYITNPEDKKKIKKNWKELKYIDDIFNKKGGALKKESKSKYKINRKFQGNEILEGHIITNITMGLHVNMHNKNTNKFFVPFVDYCNTTLMVYRLYKLLYIILHFEDISNYINESKLNEYRSDFKDKLKSIEFDKTNLFDNTIKYKLSNNKFIILIHNGIARCPLTYDNLSIKNWKDIQYCHDNAASLKQISIDKNQDCILTPNSPTNFYMGYKIGNRSQGEMNLEEYYKNLQNRLIKLGLAISIEESDKKDEEIDKLKKELNRLKNIQSEE